MSYARESFIVPMEGLRKAHELPPEDFFWDAQGVLQRRLRVKIQPNNLCSKLFQSKLFPSCDVYLVIETGYLFLFTRDNFGYAVRVRDASKELKQKQSYALPGKTLKNGSTYSSEISLIFKKAELKLEFVDADTHGKWWKILGALLSPAADYDAVQRVAKRHASEAFSSQKLPYVAEAHFHSGGTKVEVFWRPVGAQFDKTLLNETILDSPPQDEEEEIAGAPFDEERIPPPRSSSCGPAPRHGRQFVGDGFATPRDGRQQQKLQQFFGDEVATSLRRRRQQRAPQHEEFDAEKEYSILAEGPADAQFHRTPSLSRSAYLRRKQWSELSAASPPPQDEQSKEEEEAPDAPIVEEPAPLEDEDARMTREILRACEATRREKESPGCCARGEFSLLPDEYHRRQIQHYFTLQAKREERENRLKQQNLIANRTPSPACATNASAASQNVKMEEEKMDSRARTPRRGIDGEKASKILYKQPTPSSLSRTPQIEADHRRAKTPTPRHPAIQPGEVFKPLNFDGTAVAEVVNSETSSSSMEQQQAFRSAPSPAANPQQRTRRTPAPHHVVAAAPSPEATQQPTPRRSGRTQKKDYKKFY